MQKYAEYLGSKADNHIVAYGLGDWYDIGLNPPGYAQLTSNGLTATAIYYTDIDILKNAAALLGKKDDEEKYARLADKIKAAYTAASTMSPVAVMTAEVRRPIPFPMSRGLPKGNGRK